MDPRGLLGAAVHIYVFVIVVRAVFSWLPSERRANDLYRFIFALTEPVLAPLRRLLPLVGGADFSPLVAIILLEVARRSLLG